MNKEEFEEKFGIRLDTVPLRTNRLDALSKAVKLDYGTLIRSIEGGMTGAEYNKYYGSDGDRIGVLLVKIEEVSVMIDIIVKDNEGNRFLYSVGLDQFSRGGSREGFPDFGSNDVVVWGHPIKDSNDEYFDGLDRVLDITHLLPAFSSKTAQFINWTEDPFEEVKG